jgi:hypothetical protein
MYHKNAIQDNEKNAGFILTVQPHTGISCEWRFWHSLSPAILDLQTAMPVYKHHRYLYALETLIG